MQEQLQREYDDILKQQNICTAFQTIWDHNNYCVLGYEALSRGPAGSYFHSPLTLFEYARQQNQQLELELICAQLASARFSEQGLSGQLFINFSPDTLVYAFQKYGEILFKRLIPKNAKLVIELTEHQPIEYDSILANCLSACRKLNIRFALDDFGAGYAGIKNWLQIAPEYLKLDRYFCEQLLVEHKISSALTAILELAENIGSRVIAENIETAEQYQLLLNLGVPYLQGYHIARPAVQPQQQQATPSVSLNPEPYSALSLATPQASVAPDLSSKALLDKMLEDKSLSSLPVVDHNQRVLGLLKREELLARFSGPYGHSLNQRKTAADLMDRNPLIVDIHTSLTEIGRRLSQHTASGLDAAFIVTQNNQYYGVGLAVEVMRKLANYKLQLARYANPLTALPGNVPLQRCLNQLINNHQDFSLAYFDLNNFKPFNDICGYERGDQMIKLVAELIKLQLTKYAHFIGHLGGDDFIVIFTQTGWQQAILNLLKQFDVKREALYRQKDLDAGGIIAKDRDGQQRRFPLCGLAVGVTPWTANCGLSIEALSEQASFAKKQAKLSAQSNLYIANTAPAVMLVE
ncbi:GGDEF domain-containing protein [Agarivorans sp.]|uniref:GGDEF domain-containing protein n=1 Tax=Agarivorans sp. TaxID=1872412 RepID=UPI003D0112CB